MTLRARIFIMLTVFVLAVLSVSLFLYVRSRPKKADPADNNTVTEQNSGNVATGFVPVTNQNGGGTPVVVTQPLVVTDPVAIEKAGVEQLARVFTERYQTFSSDNNYANIRQVETLVTADLWKNLSARLKVPPTKTFTGVTTDAFATDVVSFGDGKATVVAQTRRTMDQNGKITVTNQNYKIELLKVGSSWLVDSFVVSK